MLLNFFRLYRLRKNCANFIKLSALTAKNGDTFYGWGRKFSGLLAVKNAAKHKANFCLLEDGFVRSLRLSSSAESAKSMVFDDIGIYYDASKPSRLEKILNEKEFSDEELAYAKKCIEKLIELEISKYNDSDAVFSEDFAQFCKKDLDN